MAANKYNENYIIDIYCMARDGLRNSSIAAALDISTATLKKWRDNKPAVRYALQRARENRNAMGEATFADYIYKHLPPNLRNLWDEIHAAEAEPNAVERVEVLLSRAGMRARQHLFIHAWVSSNFNISAAMRRLQVPRQTFEQWVRTEPEFAELMDEIEWHKKNFFEEHLIRLVRSGDGAATVFANKTANADRYPTTARVEHTGTIQHNHTVIPVAELNLPTDMLRTILGAAQLHAEANALAHIEGEVYEVD